MNPDPLEPVKKKIVGHVIFGLNSIPGVKVLSYERNWHDFQIRIQVSDEVSMNRMFDFATQLKYQGMRFEQCNSAVGIEYNMFVDFAPIINQAYTCREVELDR